MQTSLSRAFLTIAGSDSGWRRGHTGRFENLRRVWAHTVQRHTRRYRPKHARRAGRAYRSGRMVRQQCESVFSDIRIDAVKIGMLPDTETIRTVADVLRRHPAPFVVADPVLVATSGDSLALEIPSKPFCPS